ncbi:hypothetical protein [Micromonospora sp. L32]|uniref:hypothetical protein n=1 Tax=Micromonospora TaxID=1873 RepID=UPI003F88CB0D
MRETALDEMFAEFEADARTVIRPPGVAAAQARVRARRRRRRGLLAGMIALLLGGPAGAFAVAGRHDGPPTPPEPPAMARRTVVVPGAVGELADLEFVDARHGWALFTTCTREAPTGCRRTLGRTTDGGATWQGSALPVSDGGAYLDALDGQTATVVTGQEFHVTTDGGRTFTRHPESEPPLEQRASPNSPSGFRLACPPELEARGQDCASFHLARVDSRPVRQQPPLTLDRGSAADLVEGNDGRLWVSTMTDGRTTVVVSADQARTWRKLPSVAAEGRPVVSPEGTDVWLVDGAERAVWHLVGDEWQPRPELPHRLSANGVAAAGEGAILVNSFGRVGFYVNGSYVDQPALRDALAHSGSSEVALRALRDGTLVLQGEGAWRIVGVGSGTDRTWTWFS